MDHNEVACFAPHKVNLLRDTSLHVPIAETGDQHREILEIQLPVADEQQGNRKICRAVRGAHALGAEGVRKAQVPPHKFTKNAAFPQLDRGGQLHPVMSPHVH